MRRGCVTSNRDSRTIVKRWGNVSCSDTRFLPLPCMLPQSAMNTLLHLYDCLFTQYLFSFISWAKHVCCVKQQLDSVIRLCIMKWILWWDEQCWYHDTCPMVEPCLKKGHITFMWLLAPVYIQALNGLLCADVPLRNYSLTPVNVRICVVAW